MTVLGKRKLIKYPHRGGSKCTTWLAGEQCGDSRCRSANTDWEGHYGLYDAPGIYNATIDASDSKRYLDDAGNRYIVALIPRSGQLRYDEVVDLTDLVGYVDSRDPANQRKARRIFAKLELLAMHN